MKSRIPLKPLIRSVFPRLHYAPVILRGLWRKHFGITVDRRRNDGLALRPPYQISLRITNRCNQHCAICGQFGDRGYMKAGERSGFLDELEPEIYERMVDSVIKHRPVFYITGGEAFLYKDLFRLTGYIKSQKGLVYVITNGSLLEKHVDEILGQSWDMLTVSLDGPAAIHDQCRGVPGSFDTATRGIRSLLSGRARSRRRNPFFMLSATVSVRNQDSIEEIFEIASDLKPDGLVLYLSWFTTREIGERHSALVREHLGVETSTWKSYIGQNEGIDAEKLRQTLEKLKKKKFPFLWLSIPSITAGRIPAYYREPENFLGYGPCVAPYLMLDIMPNGDVVTCRDFVDIKVGNIREQPLPKIWNNKKFRDFRKLLKNQGGVLPQCSRCCGLMGF